MPPAPPAHPEGMGVIPSNMRRHTFIPSVSEGIPVEPPSPGHLWRRSSRSRSPSLHHQYRQEPIYPPSGPPRSHQSVYPPPLVPPPVGAPSVPTFFGSPAGGVIEPPSLGPPGGGNIIIQPAAGAVIQPPTMFPPPIVAPGDLQPDSSQTRQNLRTPRVTPIPITIEGASRRTPSPPYFPPGHSFGSPSVSMTHDDRSRRSPIIIPGSPRSPSRGSPGRPSRSYRSSRSPRGRTIVVQGPPALPRSRRSRSHRSQSPPPPMIGPQLPPPIITVQPESRGRSRHRVPPHSTALDRSRSHVHSRTPSPDQYRPHPSHRDGSRHGSRRPRSPIIIHQPGSILPPVTAGQPPVVPFDPTTQPPVTFVQEPAPPRRLQRSHRHRSRTPPPQTPMVILPPGSERPPRSGSWDRPRHHRNLLERWGRRRRRSHERPHRRDHDYDDYDRGPRYYSPSRRHERSRSRLRRSSRSPVRSHSYSPEPRRSHRRRGGSLYSYRGSLSPPRTSRRSRPTIFTGPEPRSSRRRDRSYSPSVIVTRGEHGERSYQRPRSTLILPGDDHRPRSSRRRDRSYSPSVIVTQGEHGGRSYQRPRSTLILPGDDHRPPSQTPISIAPSHRLSRPPSIEFVPPSLYSERLHEWEAPHPLVSALYLDIKQETDGHHIRPLVQPVATHLIQG